jgi:hypothetical protein
MDRYRASAKRTIMPMSRGSLGPSLCGSLCMNAPPQVTREVKDRRLRGTHRGSWGRVHDCRSVRRSGELTRFEVVGPVGHHCLKPRICSLARERTAFLARSAHPRWLPPWLPRPTQPATVNPPLSDRQLEPTAAAGLTARDHLVSHGYRTGAERQIVCVSGRGGHGVRMRPSK